MYFLNEKDVLFSYLVINVYHDEIPGSAYDSYGILKFNFKPIQIVVYSFFFFVFNLNGIILYSVLLSKNIIFDIFVVVLPLPACSRAWRWYLSYKSRRRRRHANPWVKY